MLLERFLKVISFFFSRFSNPFQIGCGRRGGGTCVWVFAAEIVHWWRKANYHAKISFVFNTRGFRIEN